MPIFSPNNYRLPIRRTQRAIALALCASVVVPMSSFVHTPEAEAGWSPPNSPKDMVNISVQSDGTHNGPGTETFLNSSNGYVPGDDTSTDGVVSTGDVVTYEVGLTIVAGKERDLRIYFENDSDWLELGDFSSLSLNNGIVDSRWDGNNILVHIPRGASGKLIGTVSVRAKDTQGEVKGGNSVKASLQDSEGFTVFSSQSKEITVISAPLADLTIDTVFPSYRSYTQDSIEGEFYINPMGLKIEGYSSHGLISSTKWSADIDVSDFPQGTMWKADNSPVDVVNGKLLNVSSEGSIFLTYSLPEEAKPTKENQSQRYQIKLDVHKDSFSVGSSTNIPDPGNNQPPGFATSTYTYKNKNVGALDGRLMPNNNYSVATWYFYEDPAGDIWRYDTAAPWDQNKTYFEDQNLYWNPGSPYHTQGMTYPLRGFATTDNDMYNRMTILAKNLSEFSHSDDIVATDSLDVGTGDDYLSHSYDISRKVAVTVGGVVLDSAKYKAEFFVDGQWIESDAPVEGASSSRVTFSPDAFSTGENSPVVLVYWPVKAGKNYDPNNDSGKLLRSRGSFDINVSNLPSDVSYDLGTKNLDVNVPLTFMQAPSVRSDIEAVGDPRSIPNSSRYLTSWSIVDTVAKPPISRGYSATRTITLDSIYDAKTFRLSEPNGWEVSKIEGQTVTLTRSNIVIIPGKDNIWDMGKTQFTVESITNPNDGTGKPIAGNATENLTLQWNNVPGLGSGSDTSSDVATQNINSLNLLSQHLKALGDKREVDETLSWEARVNLGRLTQEGTEWSQDIIMPYIGDVENIDKLNEVNNTTIAIDDETGKDTTGTLSGVGRSKFHGTYAVQGVTVFDAPENTTVEFKSSDGATLAVKTVGPEGVVDLSGIDTHNVRTVSVHGVDNISSQQSAGLRVKIDILPEGNEENDDYVMWMSPVSSPAIPDAGVIMAWPDSLTTVMSEVEGTLWQDSNRNGIFDSDEKDRFSGVTVSLRKLVDGKWIVVPDRAGRSYTTTTDKDGKYRFEGLHSGTYQVKLDNVEKDRMDTTDIDSVSGSTGDSARDGDLVHSSKNRFDVTTVTSMTRSYRDMLNKSNDTVVVDIARDSTTSKVDYGFVVDRADAVLDKLPGQSWWETMDVRTAYWDIEVKNTGNTILRGLQFNDRMSNEIFNPSVNVGHTTRTPWGMEGEVIDIASDPGVGWYVAGTTQGLYVNYSHGDPTIKKIEGVSGPVTDVEGDQPRSAGYLAKNDQGVWIGSNQNQPPILATSVKEPVTIIESTFPAYGDHGYLIGTENGAYIGVADGNSQPRKIEGITGKVLAMTGRQPTGRGYAISTTDGLWVASNGDETPRKVPGLPDPKEDPVILLTGFYPSSFVEGYAAATATSVYNGYDTYLDVKRDYNGEAVELLGERPMNNTQGYLFRTKDDVYIGGGTNQITSLMWRGNISGNLIDVSGDIPINDKGYAILTTEGLWTGSGVADQYGQWGGVGLPRYVPGFTGQGTMIHGKYPMDSRHGYAIGTEDGLWSGYGSREVHKIDRVTGNVTHIVGYGPYQMDGFTVVTDEGAWSARGNGELAVVAQQGVRETYIESENLVQIGDTIVESNKQGREFAKRTYILPDIAPGETLQVSVRGNFRNSPEDMILGNQAWINSDVISRAGIEVTTKGEVKVTGEGKQPGIPDVPELPSKEDFDENGIYGTNTVAINTSIDSDSSIVDDIADQTPIFAMGDTDVAPLDASISGVAWYDLDGNNVRDDSDTRASGIKVRAYSKYEEGDYVDDVLLGEAVTNDRGEWEIKGLRDGERVKIIYDIAGHKHEGKVWSSVIPGNDNSSVDSDIDSSGFVIRGDEVVAKTGGNSGMADAGLRTVEAGISLIKAGRKGDENLTVRGENSLENYYPDLNWNLAPRESDIDPQTGGFDDGDNDPRTNPYVYTIYNTGQSDLSNIVIEEENHEGETPAFGDVIYYSGDPDNSYFVSWDQGKIKIKSSSGSYVVLKPGEYIRGNFHVGFSSHDSTHSDTLRVSATAINEQGGLIMGVKDEDVFSVRYEQVQPKSIVLRKVAEEKRNTPEEKYLADTSFLVERTDFSGLSSLTLDPSHIKGEVGRFRTDKTGEVKFDLPSGVYKVTETIAPKGYNLPDSAKVVHFIHVYYDEAEKTRLEVKTINSSERGSFDFGVDMQIENYSDASSWGKVEIDNISTRDVQVNFRLPETGLAQLALVGVLGLGLLAGLFGWLRRSGKELNSSEM